MKTVRPQIGWLIVTILFFACAYALSSPIAQLYKNITSVQPEQIATCFAPSKDPGFASSCLHTTIAALLSEYPTKTVQAYTVATTTADVVRNNCHAIGHIIGEETYKKVGSVESALSECASTCQSACTHGALGAGVLATLGEDYPDEDIAHASDTDIARIGSQYCSQSTPLCHGIGHILYILNGDDPKALDICASISTGFAREACHQGIFMERAGENESLSPFSATSSYAVHDDDYTFPCLSVAEKFRHACFQFLPRYQSALFAKDGITLPTVKLERSSDACRTLPSKDRSYCFEGIGINADVFVSDSTNQRVIWNVCDQLVESQDRDSCTIGILPRETFLGGFGLDYCASIRDPNQQTICYNAAFTWMNKSYYYKAAQMCTQNDTSCIQHLAIYSAASTTLPDYRFGLFGE